MTSVTLIEKTIPEASPWNTTTLNLEDLKMDSNFAWLLCSLLSTMAWVIYITYYNSRVAGYVITRLINKFYATDGFFKVGEYL
jgi:hypothetical protein